MTWILREDPGTSLWCLQPMAKCIQTRKHKYTFTTSISSWQCNYSTKRLLFCRLEHSAKTTDIPMSGSAVKNHIWPKKGRQLHAKRTTSYLLLFQGYPPVLVATRRQHRHYRICLQQVQPKREVRRLVRITIKNPNTKIKSVISIEIRTSVLRDLPELLAEFTDNLEDTSTCTRTHFSKLIFGTSYESSQKTEIAKSACEPKWQGAPCWRRTGDAPLRAEKYGDWITMKSERRYLSSIATNRIGWKMVGWFYGMLLLSAKCPRPPARRENSIRKTIWRTIQR